MVLVEGLPVDGVVGSVGGGSTATPPELALPPPQADSKPAAKQQTTAMRQVAERVGALRLINGLSVNIVRVLCVKE